MRLAAQEDRDLGLIFLRLPRRAARHISWRFTRTSK